MLEYADMVWIAVAVFIAAIAYPILHNWGLDARMSYVERRLQAREMDISRGKGQHNAEREEAAIMEIIAAAQGGQDIGAVIKQVGMKYPDVLMKYAKKLKG